MALLGLKDGIPVYEQVEDVSDEDLERGTRFYVLAANAPRELESEGMAFYSQQSPFSPVVWTFLTRLVLAVAILALAITFYLTIRVILVESHQGQRIDENTWEDASGCIYQKDPSSGRWEKIGCPSPLVGLGGALIVAIGLIAVILIVWGLWKSGVFGAAAKKISGSPGPKEKPKKKSKKKEKPKESGGDESEVQD